MPNVALFGTLVCRGEIGFVSETPARIGFGRRNAWLNGVGFVRHNAWLRQDWVRSVISMPGVCSVEGTSHDPCGLPENRFSRKNTPISSKQTRATFCPDWVSRRAEKGTEGITRLAYQTSLFSTNSLRPLFCIVPFFASVSVSRRGVRGGGGRGGGGAGRVRTRRAIRG
jgi:hypothetical protein